MFIIRLIDLKFHSLFFFSLTFIFKLSFFFFSFIYRSFFNHLLKNLFVIYVDNIQQVFILILFHFYSWNRSLKKLKRSKNFISHLLHNFLENRKPKPRFSLILSAASLTHTIFHRAHTQNRNRTPIYLYLFLPRL